MSNRRIAGFVAASVLIALPLCARADSPAAADAASEPAPVRPGQVAAERPATKQARLSIEGTEEALTLTLFDAAAASPPETFSTYVPNDMLAEPAPRGVRGSVRFVANFGGVRQDQAFLEVRFYPPATEEASARSRLNVAVPHGVPLRPVDPAAKQFGWSRVEYSFAYASKTAGRVLGVTALGRHADTFFQVTLQYPREYGEGFVPRALRILEEWRWRDTGAGL